MPVHGWAQRSPIYDAYDTIGYLLLSVLCILICSFDLVSGLCLCLCILTEIYSYMYTWHLCTLSSQDKTYQNNHRRFTRGHHVFISLTPASCTRVPQKSSVKKKQPQLTKRWSLPGYTSRLSGTFKSDVYIDDTDAGEVVMMMIVLVIYVILMMIRFLFQLCCLFLVEYIVVILSFVCMRLCVRALHQPRAKAADSAKVGVLSKQRVHLNEPRALNMDVKHNDMPLLLCKYSALTMHLLIGISGADDKM